MFLDTVILLHEALFYFLSLTFTFLPTCSNLRTANLGPFSIHFFPIFSFLLVNFSFPPILHKFISLYFVTWRVSPSAHSQGGAALSTGMGAPMAGGRETHQHEGRQIPLSDKCAKGCFLLRETQSHLWSDTAIRRRQLKLSNTNWKDWLSSGSSGNLTVIFLTCYLCRGPLLTILGLKRFIRSITFPKKLQECQRRFRGTSSGHILMWKLDKGRV